MKQFETSLFGFLSKYDEWEVPTDVPYPSIFKYIYSPKYNLYLHLVSTSFYADVPSKDYYQKMSLHCYHQHIKLIHLREEQWLTKQDFIKHRLLSIFEENKKVHARACKIIRINKKTYDDFLNENHLLQTASTRFKYGLFKDNILLAVMGISAGRWMTQENDLRKSFEIIRFASKTNTTVVGGFSKMLKHIEAELEVEEWMTYYDLDWVQTNVYTRLGFVFKQIMNPQEINSSDNKTKMYNAGNLKFVKRVK